jgi:hypothetical protein
MRLYHRLLRGAILLLVAVVIRPLFCEVDGFIVPSCLPSPAAPIVGIHIDSTNPRRHHRSNCNQHCRCSNLLLNAKKKIQNGEGFSSPETTAEGEMSDTVQQSRRKKDGTIIDDELRSNDTILQEEGIEQAATETIFGFTPSNFDQSKIPVPLWTGLVVFAFSMYVTFYGFYVGIMGFPPDDSPLPRIF